MGLHVAPPESFNIDDVLRWRTLPALMQAAPNLGVEVFRTSDDVTAIAVFTVPIIPDKERGGSG
jgi:hypothetical protein